MENCGGKKSETFIFLQMALFLIDAKSITKEISSNPLKNQQLSEVTSSDSSVFLKNVVTGPKNDNSRENLNTNLLEIAGMRSFSGVQPTRNFKAH